MQRLHQNLKSEPWVFTIAIHSFIHSLETGSRYVVRPGLELAITQQKAGFELLTARVTGVSHMTATRNISDGHFCIFLWAYLWDTGGRSESMSILNFDIVKVFPLKIISITFSVYKRFYLNLIILCIINVLNHIQSMAIPPWMCPISSE